MTEDGFMLGKAEGAGRVLTKGEMPAECVLRWLTVWVGERLIKEQWGG